jgi:hypothetical protein
VEAVEQRLPGPNLRAGVDDHHPGRTQAFMFCRLCPGVSVAVQRTVQQLACHGLRRSKINRFQNFWIVVIVPGLNSHPYKSVQLLIDATCHLLGVPDQNWNKIFRYGMFDVKR